jgi:hypothetical protein
MPATFIHSGVVFEIVEETANLKHVSPGMWLRLSYGPPSSKPDEVGEVISIEPALDGWLGDYRIEMARDGNRNDVRDLRSHDGHFELVRKR